MLALCCDCCYRKRCRSFYLSVSLSIPEPVPLIESGISLTSGTICERLWISAANYQQTAELSRWGSWGRWVLTASRRKHSGDEPVRTRLQLQPPHLLLLHPLRPDSEPLLSPDVKSVLHFGVSSEHMLIPISISSLLLKTQKPNWHSSTRVLPGKHI